MLSDKSGYSHTRNQLIFIPTEMSEWFTNREGSFSYTMPY